MNKGFTIVEILLVVVVIAIASTWTAIDFYQSLDSTALRSGTMSVKRAAGYARLIAGQRHQACKLHVNLDEGTYWLTVKERARPVGADKQEENEESVLEIENVYQRKRKVDEKVRFEKAQVEGSEAVSTGEVTIAFNVQGSAESAFLQISSEYQTRTILVYPWSGRTQIHSGAIDELPCETIDLDTAGMGDLMGIK